MWICHVCARHGRSILSESGHFRREVLHSSKGSMMNLCELAWECGLSVCGSRNSEVKVSGSESED